MSKILRSKIPPNLFCRPCAATTIHKIHKPTRLPNPHPQHPIVDTKGPKSSYPGLYLHIDLHGKVKHVTRGGCAYFAVVVDDFSNRVFTILLRKKRHFFPHLTRLIDIIEGETNNRVVKIKADGDGIFRKEEFQAFLDARHILFTPSTPYVSHHNGKAERAIGVIKRMARTMLVQSGLPRSYWGEAVLYATHILNRLPRKGVPPPFNCALSAWRGSDIDNPLKPLHPFGCETWALDHKVRPSNVSIPLAEQTGVPCIFLGLQSDKGSYRVISLVHDRLLHTIHVKFNDNSFPVTSQHHYKLDFDALLTENDKFLEPIIRDKYGEIEGNIPPSHNFDDPVPSSNLPENASREVRDTPVATRTIHDPNKGRNSRAFLEQFATNSLSALYLGGDDHAMSKAESDNHNKIVREILSSVCKGEKGGYNILVNSLKAVVHNIPSNQKQAYNSEEKDKWIEAESRHLKLLAERMWADLVDLPPGKKAIPVRWVYDRKGKEAEHTARLVLLGFLQRYGIDYNETYSPTVQWRVIRYLLALWTINDWEVGEKVDLKQAFNSTPIDISILVKQPPGHEIKGLEHKVYKLNKSLPGGKQMSRNLHLALRKLLIEKAGFRSILTDGCVYRWDDPDDLDNFLILVIWVDDCFFFGKSVKGKEKIDSVCELLRRSEYNVHRLGEITQSSVLGCRVLRDRASRTTTIDLVDSIEDLLRSYKDSSGVSYWDSEITAPTPCDPKSQIPSSSMNADNDEEKKVAAEYNYLSRIMSLMYISLVARPDISYAVGVAARYSSSPGKAHIEWVERIFRYLRGTSNLKLTYSIDISKHTIDDVRLKIFSDTSWLDEKEHRYTTMGRAVFLGDCLIDWKSKLIKRVMTSTNHAEFYGMNESAKDAEFFRIFSGEIGIKNVADRVEILGDNAKALSLAQGTLSHSDNRYYDLCLFYQRELFDLKRIFYTFVKGVVNVADYFTKGILFRSLDANHKVRAMLGLR